MNKGVLVGIIVFILVIGLIGGGIWVANNANLKPQSSSPNTETIEALTVPTTVPETTTTSEIEANGKEVEFTVDGSNFKYVPATLKVKKGDTVRVLFKNVGGFHDFVIDEFEVKSNQIGDGDEEEVEFIASKTGAFD